MGAAAGHVGCAEKRLHAGEVAVPQVEAGRGGVGRWAVVGGVHAKRPEVGDGDKSTRAPLQHGSSSVDTSASCAGAVAEAVHGTAATRRPMYWTGAVRSITMGGRSEKIWTAGNLRIRDSDPRLQEKSKLGIERGGDRDDRWVPCPPQLSLHMCSHVRADKWPYRSGLLLKRC
jgi:hypothetical protein